MTYNTVRGEEFSKILPASEVKHTVENYPNKTFVTAKLYIL